MRPRSIFTLAITLALAASAAHAADALMLARKLVGYTGGVSLILRNFEGGMAASTGAPDIFKQSFDQAIADNGKMLAAADEDLAKAYAKSYPADLMEREVAFYESPEAQAIMAQSRESFGAVVWPDPGSPGVTEEQSAALVKFRALVKERAAIAARSSEAADAIMTAETDALVAIRSAAFANYCKARDCKAEGITPPPQ